MQAGIIGLPFAVKECGLWLGISLLVVFGILTDYGACGTQCGSLFAIFALE